MNYFCPGWCLHQPGQPAVVGVFTAHMKQKHEPFILPQFARSLSQIHPFHFEKWNHLYEHIYH